MDSIKKEWVGAGVLFLIALIIYFIPYFIIKVVTGSKKLGILVTLLFMGFVFFVGPAVLITESPETFVTPMEVWRNEPYAPGYAIGVFFLWSIPTIVELFDYIPQWIAVL